MVYSVPTPSRWRLESEEFLQPLQVDLRTARGAAREEGPIGTGRQDRWADGSASANTDEQPATACRFDRIGCHFAIVGIGPQRPGEVGIVNDGRGSILNQSGGQSLANCAVARHEGLQPAECVSAAGQQGFGRTMNAFSDLGGIHRFLDDTLRHIDDSDPEREAAPFDLEDSVLRVFDDSPYQGDVMLQRGVRQGERELASIVEPEQVLPFLATLQQNVGKRLLEDVGERIPRRNMHQIPPLSQFIDDFRLGRVRLAEQDHLLRANAKRFQVVNDLQEIRQ